MLLLLLLLLLLVLAAATAEHLPRAEAAHKLGSIVDGIFLSEESKNSEKYIFFFVFLGKMMISVLLKTNYSFGEIKHLIIISICHALTN